MHMSNGGDSIVDYVHAEDFVDAVVSVLDRRDHSYGAYNVETGEGTTLSELAGVVKRLLPAAPISVGHGRHEFQPGLPMRNQGALDITRARDELGYAPKYGIEQGLEDLIHARA